MVKNGGLRSRAEQEAEYSQMIQVFCHLEYGKSYQREGKCLFYGVHFNLSSAFISKTVS